MKFFQQKEFDFKSAKKNPSKKRRWKLWAIGGIFVLILAGAVYFSIFSPFFKIGEIKIAGAQTVSEEKIISLTKNLTAKKWLGILPLDSLAVFPSEKLSKNISEEFAQISRAEIKKIFPKTLEIKIEERQPAAVWCQNEAAKEIPSSAENAVATSTPPDKEIMPQGDNCFFVDETGIIFRSSPKISSSFLPLIFGAAGQNFSLRARSLASSTLEFARQVKKDLENENIEVGLFLENEQLKELETFTEPGWKIYFNLGQSPESQLRVVRALFDQELKNNRTNLQYIDLRIPGRAYYK